MQNPVNEFYFKRHFAVQEPDIRFYDVREAPFRIYGLYQPEAEPVFKRLPDAVAAAASEIVGQLYTNTSGGRVRFSTNSRYVAIKAEMPYISNRSIMSLLCSAGFDLYVKEGGQEVYYSSFRPPIDMTDGYENILYFPDRRQRELTLYFPLYNDVSRLLVGLEKNARLEKGTGYRRASPVVYYGSSITQGASASRPGMSYEAQISRKLDCDFRNFGFAAGAKGERAIAEYLAGLSCSAFVCDYDYNAPTAEHLEKTHGEFYRIVRSAQKEVPILMLSRPVTSYANLDNRKRRDIVYQTCRAAWESGDDGVYFIDGFSLFGADGMEDCLADGIHPNDLGFYRMASVISKVLEKAWGKADVQCDGPVDPRSYL